MKVIVGKTEFTVALDAFIAIFIPKFVEINNSKFWVIISSYSIISVNELFSKCKTKIKDVVDLFHEVFPNDRLVTGLEAKKYPPYNNFKDTDEKIEYGILVNEKVEPYSLIIAIAAGTVRDGITCNFLHLDESQFCTTEDFGSLQSFGASSNPVTMLTGIESQNTNNAQYEMKQFGKELVDRYTIPFPLAYKTINLTHIDRALDALKFFINVKVKKLGLNSTEVATNYMMRSDILNGRFLTKEYMERNNMLTTDIYDHKQPNVAYRCLGVDFASSLDHCAGVITDCYIDEFGEYRYEVRHVRILNPAKERISQDFIAETIATMCKTYEICMILCDTSGTQQPYASALIKAIKRKNINTFVVGFAFSGASNKVEMMSFLESVLVGQQCKLPKIEYKDSDKGFAHLYKELLTLKKDKDTSKSQNLRYYAKLPDTDDAVMALALSVYCVKRVEWMISKNKMIDIEDKSYFPRLNKFKLLSDSPTNTQPIRDSYISGLF